ncbi:glycosyltransferase family 8 protein [Actinomadura sp. 6K520]|uniref:glycosyltransferase family 8 protein n=1 Tax=Actinomadura sp. 6K520 TaxID=2530364 RepID=UPI0010520FFA|nr:glycosyltransferase family 8 protein [Actinomadura sp. 6K520]TDE32137.1 glycosyltransferase family 8 protein [Actinomadura sp. 6K520]
MKRAELAPEAAPADLVPIVCCVDDRYVLPLCVLMTSLAAVPEHTALRVLLLHQDLSRTGQERVAFHADRLGIELEVHPVQPARSAPVSAWVSQAVYLRLEIGDTLGPRGTVLYLDVDTLVLGDLNPLRLTPLEGAPLGAVRDPQNPVIGAGIAFPGWAELGLPRGRDYFNSGVMLFDLAVCEQQGLFTAARRFLTDHGDQVRLWDQDALNFAAADQWRRLDRRWNTFALSPLATQPGYRHHDAEPYAPLAMLLADEPTAAVLHFAGPAKPWRDDYPPGRAREIYRRYLKTVEWSEFNGS